MKTIKAALGIGVRRAGQRKQTGVATILVILMVGVGLVAVSVGTMHTMRNSQERQLVAHSQVNAQAGAWAAVEAVRKLLGTLTAEQLAGLVKNNEWTISGTGVEGLTQMAVVTDITPPASSSEKDYKIKAQISSVATAGQSSSTIEVVYEVRPGATPTPFELTGVLDFYNDLEMSGEMNLKSPDAGLSFNVDGDFNATSLSITGSGLKKMAVTGNITVGSNIKVEELWAKNVTIVGGASATKVFAFGDPDATDDTCCGNVRMTGGTGVTQINANGSVDSGGGGVDEINARRNISITRGGSNHKRLTAGGTVTNTSGGNITEFIKSIGNVTLSGVTMTGSPGVLSKGNVTNSGSATVSKITALGTVTVNANGTVDNIKSGSNIFLTNVGTKTVEAVGDVICTLGYTEYLNIKAGGMIKDCKPSSVTTIYPGWSSGGKVDTPVVDITIPEKVPPITLDQPKVNAWLLRSEANYALEINADGLPQVTVKSVKGVADGAYFLRAVQGSGTSREFLCKTLTSDKTLCAAKSDSNPVHAFCYGESDKNSCISFTVADGTSIDAKGEKIRDKFTIGGKTLVPGVVWIKGDVVLNNGTYYNTIIATGNVSTSGAVVSYALNYAAAYEKLSSGSSKNAVCKLDYANTAAAKAFEGQYPTNYCVGDKYTSSPVGNIGILAGGYNTADASAGSLYSGGYINLAASNAIYGTVVSGNILETGGSTHVYGYISAAGLKQNEDEKNKLTQSTTVDLTNLPEGYDPTKIPDMSGGSSGTTAKSEVLWSRYL